MAAKSRNVVISLRSKGIPTFNRAVAFDVRYQAVAFVTDFLDIFISFLVTVASLSWGSWISIAISMVSIGWTNATNSLQSTVDLVFLVFAHVILPTIMVVYMVFGRREKGLTALVSHNSTHGSCGRGCTANRQLYRLRRGPQGPRPSRHLTPHSLRAADQPKCHPRLAGRV
jgi:hypothetical protein